MHIIDLDDDERYRFEEGMKKIAKTYSEKRPNNSHWVLNRRLGHSDNRDVAVVFGYNNWAELDVPFAADFDLYMAKEPGIFSLMKSKML